ncbi:hypothetical protein G7046_g985 [Stylonectria norvegica]|nr:hypothetical protein G7046_g985 [Stylonectria norvegica]
MQLETGWQAACRLVSEAPSKLPLAQKVAATCTPPEQRSTDRRAADLSLLQHDCTPPFASTHPDSPPMASEEPLNHLAESGVTMHSDSEQYSGGEELSSPPSSNSPLILYKPPTVWSLVRGTAINLFLPFINGMMLGFGELFAHEAAFRLGWGGTKLRRLDWIVYGKVISLTKPRYSHLLDGERIPSVLESKFKSDPPTCQDHQWTTLRAWSERALSNEAPGLLFLGKER